MLGFESTKNTPSIVAELFESTEYFKDGFGTQEDSGSFLALKNLSDRSEIKGKSFGSSSKVISACTPNLNINV